MGESLANGSVEKSYFDVYEKIKEVKGTDWTGEVGEFHAMVIDAPFFSRHIEFKVIFRRMILVIISILILIIFN